MRYFDERAEELEKAKAAEQASAQSKTVAFASGTKKQSKFAVLLEKEGIDVGIVDGAAPPTGQGSGAAPPAFVETAAKVTAKTNSPDGGDASASTSVGGHTASTYSNITVETVDDGFEAAKESKNMEVDDVGATDNVAAKSTEGDTPEAVPGVQVKAFSSSPLCAGDGVGKHPTSTTTGANSFVFNDNTNHVLYAAAAATPAASAPAASSTPAATAAAAPFAAAAATG